MPSTPSNITPPKEQYKTSVPFLKFKTIHANKYQDKPEVCGKSGLADLIREIA
jgi:hypothetical protein